MISHPRFDLTGPLPSGTVTIEASAGTGKTFTLAALATRYVAEGDVRASELLIVTFTRAATAELRARVRARLVEAAHHLVAGGESKDPLLQHLAALPDRATVALRLQQAVTEFDAATVSTIHGFAAQVLAALGSAGHIDPELPLVDDAVDLAGQICADALASASAAGHADLPGYDGFTKDVLAVLDRPGLVIQPEPGPGVNQAMELHRRLVGEAVDELAAHRRRIGTRSFSDILTVLRDALSGTAGAGAAADALRARYRVALIDEFQDTDPVQWDIFRTLFGTSGPVVDNGGQRSALVLVGDPKQAIYAFRGADVNTYLAAVSSGSDTRSLDTNWRSDGAALDALATLLDGVSFGDEAIRFKPVSPAPGHEQRRLSGADGAARPGLVLRLAVHENIDRIKAGTPSADGARAAIWADMAERVTDLLVDGRLPADGPDGGHTRYVLPSDIAVLVRSRKDAESVRDTLVQRGIPAVVARGESVLKSEAATHWRWLLEGLARPSDPVRARTFSLSWFGGRSPAWAVDAPDEEIAEVQDVLHRWADTLTTRGVDSLVRQVFRESGVVERALATADGDRAVTDLEHVAELFRTQTTGGRPGVAALTAVLDVDPEADPNAEFEGDLASRRVASEEAAVQVMTVWVAKGLEFPIVCLPTMWSKPVTSKVIYNDPVAGRAFDLAGGKAWPDKAGAKARKDIYELERCGEDLRLLYVALTRARHQTIVWWSPVSGSEGSPLGRVLFCRDADGSLDREAFAKTKAPKVGCDEALDRLAWCADRPGAIVEVSEVPGVHEPTPRWSPAPHPQAGAELAVSELTATPPRHTRRWSFTGISSRAESHFDAGPAAPADREIEEADEPAEPVNPVDPVEVDPTVASASGFDDPTVSPMAPLPAGNVFGTLVHSIYENVPFDHPDLPAAVRDQLGRELSWRTLSLAPTLPEATEEDGRRRLVDGIVASIHTPLGPLFDGLTLRDLPASERLAELGFELHLPRTGTLPTDRHIGEILLAHLRADDPFRPWAEEVAAGVFDVELAGHLNGEIDAVLRVRAEGRPDRYVVVDYKTNRLHPHGQVPGPDDYGRARMIEQMRHHHYPLQALLYSVALHRYLRWRLPGYRPEHHLGGVAYLFVRGMSGEHTRGGPEAPHGVCTWSLPPAAVVAVSDLLAGVRAVEEQGSLFDLSPQEGAR